MFDEPDKRNAALSEAQPGRILQLAPLPVDADYKQPEEFDIVRLDQISAPGDWLEEHGASVVVVITHAMKAVDRALIEQLPSLKLIAVFGVGLDRVNLEAARERKVAVTYTPDLLTNDVADLAMALVLAARRQTVPGDRYIRSGQWGSTMFPLSRSVTGARLGIVGMGRIGRALAQRARAFGIEIAYTGRSRQADSPFAFVADVTALAEWSDILVAILPGGDATRGIIDRDCLTALGPAGTFVNVGRSSSVDETALLDLLATGKLWSAALDVFECEPAVDARWLNTENAVLSPHVGSATVETRRAMADHVFDNVCRALAGDVLIDRAA